MTIRVPHVALAGALTLAACGGAKVKIYPGLDRREVATSVATNVIVPALEAQVTALAALESALSALAAAPADIALRDAAKAAFAQAMVAVQRAELMQVGPGGNPIVTMGGLGIRSDIYDYETQNACYVDAILAGGQFTSDATLASQPLNRRGLAAVEYLLYYEGTTSSCAANPTLLAGVADLPTSRATYALASARLARIAAEALRDAWAPTGGNFLANIQQAGVSPSIYRTGQEALNSISDAMFYLELATKDMKLAPPAGYSACTSDAGICPTLVESRYAGLSLVHIDANLDAFRELFLGGSGIGFDDLLYSVGQEALSGEILAEIEAVEAALANVSGPLEEAVVSDKADVDTLYTALQTLTTTVKVQMVAVLDLQLPDAAGDDTD